MYGVVRQCISTLTKEDTNGKRLPWGGVSPALSANEHAAGKQCDLPAAAIRAAKESRRISGRCVCSADAGDATAGTNAFKEAHCA